MGCHLACWHHSAEVAHAQLYLLDALRRTELESMQSRRRSFRWHEGCRTWPATLYEMHAVYNNGIQAWGRTWLGVLGNLSAPLRVDGGGAHDQRRAAVHRDCHACLRVRAALADELACAKSGSGVTIRSYLACRPRAHRPRGTHSLLQGEVKSQTKADCEQWAPLRTYSGAFSHPRRSILVQSEISDAQQTTGGATGKYGRGHLRAAASCRGRRRAARLRRRRTAPRAPRSRTPPPRSRARRRCSRRAPL